MPGTARLRHPRALALIALLILVAAGGVLLGAQADPRPSVRPGDVAASVPAGHPESVDDLLTANSQLGARDDAPFASAAPGAYASALRTQTSVRRLHRAAAATHAWTQAGNPPECGGATADANVCPAPAPANGNYNASQKLGFRTLSGRVSAIAYNPQNTSQIFISPTAGGVWESTDAGKSFHSIGDTLPTQLVGAIAYDAPLHRVIAVSGDNSFGGTGIAGHGIYTSSDDGRTWQVATGVPDLILGFKAVVSPVDRTGETVYAATSEGLFKSTDGGTSFVNVNLPTSPAGYSPNCAGVTAQSPGGAVSHLCFFANDVTDVVVKGTTTANGPAGAVIAAVGWRAGQRIDTDANGNNLTTCQQGTAATNCLQAPQNGLYISDTGNPGSFRYLTPTGSSTGMGLPSTPIIGRTALAIADGIGENSDAVYALVQDAQKFQGCADVLDQVPPTCNATVTGEALGTVLNGLFVTYDFGKTWTKIMDSTQLKDPQSGSALLGQAGYTPGIQGWYNLWVTADPVNHDASGDPTRVLFGLEEIWQNNQLLNTGAPAGDVLHTPYMAYPGGTAATDPWVVIGRYWNACAGRSVSPVPCNTNPTTQSPIAGSTTHPDQHAGVVIPDASGGGETLFAASDGGVFSQHITATGDYSNDGWGDGLNATITALQPYDAEMAKDGTIVSGLQDNGEMKTQPDGRESEIAGGDAFYTTIDADNSQNIIEEYTYGATMRSTDGGQSFGTLSNACTSSTALFATPLEQDPTMNGHILAGCTKLQEGADLYDPNTNNPFKTVYDLSTLSSPNKATNVPSALALRGDDAYVAYCGYCDPATQKIPFANGIATNVGGSSPPKLLTDNGWHQADAYCADCGTANGRLPERYINSIQEDPRDPNIVYVTEGGYGRRWIPPGSFGEDVSNVGRGHVFVSRDAGEHFTDITGNLPDVSANWTTFWQDHLVVATDLGVYIDAGSTGTTDTPTYDQLGSGLPNVPVFTVRNDPADVNRLLIATYGRGDFVYDFGTPAGGATRTGTQPLTGASGSAALSTGPTGSHTPVHVCPAPSGSLSATAVGPIVLGSTRTRIRTILTRYRRQGRAFDDFCLRGGPGIRVGYATPKLLAGLPGALRHRVAGRAVLAMTANPYYGFHGVTPGMTLAASRRILGGRLDGPYAIGTHRWYAQRDGATLLLLKTGHGKVLEIGVAAAELTSTRTRQRTLLRDLGA